MEIYLFSILLETDCLVNRHKPTDRPTDMTTYRAAIAAKIVIWKLSGTQ